MQIVLRTFHFLQSLLNLLHLVPVRILVCILEMAAALSPRQNRNLSVGGALALNLVDRELNYGSMDRDRIRINMI